MASDASIEDASPASPTSPTSPTSSHMSDSTEKTPRKRIAPIGQDGSAPQKIAKRRAARACVSCRARKVRCDVVEGAPCGNCRWDNVECIVQESRRRRKNLVIPSIAAAGGATDVTTSTAPHASTPVPVPAPTPTPTPTSMATPPLSISSADAARRTSNVSAFSPNDVPHALYQRCAEFRNGKTLLAQQSSSLENGRTAQFLSSLEIPDAASQLPAFVRPLPAKIAPEDVQYLVIKGALTLPDIPLQNALLQCYIEYVYPYMPLIDLHNFLSVVDRRDGVNGQTSLLLYQSIMFSAVAFVDMKHLREAGYSSRKAARKAFFQKTRLLYDFDYEQDRLVLVQSLMQMTYWYETPDDQKDTWHWMGVAISLAHTIGLHRNPGTTSMSSSKQRLWKRIWWSCFMRDRLVALGMRRPIRIKDQDFDVPMLTESDFDIQPLQEGISVVPAECTLIRDVNMQRELAVMCISKAKLCLCISHMLKVQYSVLIRDKMKPENTTNSTMMLFPNSQADNVDSVHWVDIELNAWAASLPEICQYRPLKPVDVQGGRSTVAVQRTMLHMVYHTTISALHRPQFLPSSPTQRPTTSREVQEISRLRVRDAAAQITRMASELQHLRLEKFLPTTGVTVILPAMIIHLLEMKDPWPQTRDRAIKGFRHCMRVMEKLRELYAAADYATGFLDAALRKAAIDIHANVDHETASAMKQDLPADFHVHTPPPENMPYMTTSETLFNINKVPASAPEQAVQMPMLPPDTVNAAALEISSTHSPPQTEFDSAAELTPSASGHSEEQRLVDFECLDLDFMQGHDAFDWNAVAGTELDVDQWLQFPGESSTIYNSSNSNGQVLGDFHGDMMPPSVADYSIAGVGADPFFKTESLTSLMNEGTLGLEGFDEDVDMMESEAAAQLEISV
ncbi:Cutinase transcription factor 1 beta [Claviceps humidiphila]|uniref:Cutinase transcription factor 1 beta n=1 Tax=Claviceps humidiphila TaxID=1294629 RepID=A0A9P7Q384_9HYPO|nr:Cutinase transcription factor 1 beta [Claviceps humidiphila]